MRAAAFSPRSIVATAILAVAASGADANETALSYAPVASEVMPITVGTPAPLGGRRFEPPQGRICFNPMETRDKIAAHRLTEPFRVMRMGRLPGDALRAKLCRWKPDEFVYEIAVLRRDGRVVHMYVNAFNGQDVGASEPDKH